MPKNPPQRVAVSGKLRVRKFVDFLAKSKASKAAEAEIKAYIPDNEMSFGWPTSISS
jgi:hypothetical protein